MGTWMSSLTWRSYTRVEPWNRKKSSLCTEDVFTIDKKKNHVNRSKARKGQKGMVEG